MGSFAQGDLAAYLRSRAEILALVGGAEQPRIRPNRLMQGDALPAIRYSFPGGESHQHLAGITGLAQPTLQIDCYAATSSLADRLAEAVRLALQGFRGAMGGTFVAGVLLVDRFSIYEDPVDASDYGKHRVILTFEVAHSEAAG